MHLSTRITFCVICLLPLTFCFFGSNLSYFLENINYNLCLRVKTLGKQTKTETSRNFKLYYISTTIVSTRKYNFLRTFLNFLVSQSFYPNLCHLSILKTKSQYEKSKPKFTEELILFSLYIQGPHKSAFGFDLADFRYSLG